MVGTLFCVIMLLISGDQIMSRQMQQTHKIVHVLQTNWKLKLPQFWDDLQLSHHCCGITNATDWMSSDVPLSCCVPFENIYAIKENETAVWGACDSMKAYLTGCVEVLSKEVDLMTQWFSSIAFMVSVLGLFANVVACFVHILRKEQYSVVFAVEAELKA